MTPLKQARTERHWTLAEVCARLAKCGDQIDTGNLSRIERGVQRASSGLAEALCQVFNNEINEIQVLYPERFTSSTQSAA